MLLLDLWTIYPTYLSSHRYFWFAFGSTNHVLLGLSLLLKTCILSQEFSAWKAAAVIAPVCK